MTTIRRWLVRALVAAALTLALPAWGSSPWVLVDTEREAVFVMRGEQVVLKLDGISRGRGGVALLHKAGDRVTPIGRYRVSRINRESGFHRFIGLNYPTVAHARLAYWEGVIDEPTYQAIVRSVQAGYPPPQNTPLGGHLGLHGIGAGDHRIHRRFNWTEGCIALTDQQIDSLLEFVTIGTEVVIR